MIIPFLDGFLTFSRAPITWIIILLNVFLFSQNNGLSREVQVQFESWYQDDDFLQTQGRLYKQFSQKRDVAQIVDNSLVGRLAFRDSQFLKQAPLHQWSGDHVAIEKWREDIEDFMLLRAYYPALFLGVSDLQNDFISLLSYQFYHEGLTHLLGNLLLLLIIGGFLERKHSGLIVFLVYLIGGGLAALLYSQFHGLSGAPLVGASGSLCALLGFLTTTQFKEKTRLFYFILPSKKYMGFIFVPTVYWVLWLCMLEDISGLWSQSSLFSGGVAYMVHLLGFAVGCCFGLIYLQLQRWDWRQQNLQST